MADLGSLTTPVQASDLILPQGGKIWAGKAVITPLGQVRTTHQMVYYMRQRYTIAQVNAGVALLSAVPQASIRMIDCGMCAIGGAVTQVTTVDVRATQSGAAAKLVAFGQAALTQSTLVRAGDAAGVILADGVSFTGGDTNTGITVGITGGDITVATHIDVYFTYVLEG